VDDVTLFQKKLGEVAAVLAGDASNERGLASARRTANRDQTYPPSPWITAQTVLNKFAMPCQTGKVAENRAFADITDDMKSSCMARPDLLALLWALHYLQ